MKLVTYKITVRKKSGKWGEFYITGDTMATALSKVVRTRNISDAEMLTIAEWGIWSDV